MEKEKQIIRCQIESCKYCSPDHFCQLNAICISPCRPCIGDTVESRSDSMCSNFEKKDRGLF